MSQHDQYEINPNIQAADFMACSVDELMSYAEGAANTLYELNRRGIFPHPGDGSPFAEVADRLEAALIARDDEIWAEMLAELNEEPW